MLLTDESQTKSISQLPLPLPQAHSITSYQNLQQSLRRTSSLSPIKEHNRRILRMVKETPRKSQYNSQQSLRLANDIKKTPLQNAFSINPYLNPNSHIIQSHRQFNTDSKLKLDRANKDLVKIELDGDKKPIKTVIP